MTVWRFRCHYLLVVPILCLPHHWCVWCIFLDDGFLLSDVGLLGNGLFGGLLGGGALLGVVSLFGNGRSVKISIEGNGPPASPSWMLVQGKSDVSQFFSGNGLDLCCRGIPFTCNLVCSCCVSFHRRSPHSQLSLADNGLRGIEEMDRNKLDLGYSRTLKSPIELAGLLHVVVFFHLQGPRRALAV